MENKVRVDLNELKSKMFDTLEDMLEDGKTESDIVTKLQEYVYLLWLFNDVVH